MKRSHFSHSFSKDNLYTHGSGCSGVRMQNPFTYLQWNYLIATAALWNTVIVNPRNTARITTQMDVLVPQSYLTWYVKSPGFDPQSYNLSFTSLLAFIFHLYLFFRALLNSKWYHQLLKGSRDWILLWHVPQLSDVERKSWTLASWTGKGRCCSLKQCPCKIAAVLTLHPSTIQMLLLDCTF